MKINNSEFLKIDAFKENWYALAACMCSPKVRSRVHAFGLMGIKVAKEPGIIISRNAEFDKQEVEKLYKKLRSVRQVAIQLNCNPSTLGSFIKKEEIKYEVRPLVTDNYDKKEIEKLKKEGKTVKEIAELMGYKYASLYKYIKKYKLGESL